MADITQQKTYGSETDHQSGSIQRALGDGLKQAKDNFQEVQKAVSKEAKATVQKTQEAVTNKANDVLKTTSEYVSQNPWTAVGIGAGVGLILGLLISRRE